MADHDATFALAGSEPLGKCTAEIKVSLPESLADDIAYLAHGVRMSKSEYIRDLIVRHCKGEVEAARMHASRRNGSAG